MISEKMTFKKSTKGTHVYESTESEPAIPIIYIKKKKLPENPPQNILIVVSGEADG